MDVITVFGQLGDLLKFSDRISESLEIMERYSGKRIIIRKKQRLQSDDSEDNGSDPDTPDNGRYVIVRFEGTVTEVVARPTGFLLADVTTYRGDDAPEYSDEKFVSFDDIQEIDVHDVPDTVPDDE